MKSTSTSSTFGIELVEKDRYLNVPKAIFRENNLHYELLISRNFCRKNQCQLNCLISTIGLAIREPISQFDEFLYKNEYYLQYANEFTYLTVV